MKNVDIMISKNWIKNLLKLFSVIFSIFFIIIVINTIFFNKTTMIKFSKLAMILETIIIYMIIFILYKVLNKKEKIFKIRTSNKILIGLAIFVVQLILAGLTYTRCGWDCGVIIDNSFSLYQGQGINVQYFATNPNNIALLLIFKYLYVIVGLFNEINADLIYWLPVIFNIIMIDLGCIFTLLTSTKIFGNKTTYLTLLIMIPLLIITPYLIIPYTDTITLFIPITCFYFYLKIKENTKNKYLYLFLEGILLVLGYLLKPTCIIIGIAIILGEILYSNINKNRIKQTAKKILITFLVLMLGVGIFYTGYTYVKNKNISKYISQEEFEKLSVTPTHFLMMGLKKTENTNSEGEEYVLFGAYNEEDVMNTKSYEGKEAKQQYNLEIIKKRLSNYGILGYLQFLYDKITWFMADGTFFYGAEGNFFVEEPYNQSRMGRLLQKFTNLDEKTYKIVTANAMQITWVMILIGIIFTWKNNEKNINIMKFSIIGIILFIALFEGRSRYLYNYLPIFILIGVLGIKNVIKYIDVQYENVKERIKNNKK